MWCLLGPLHVHNDRHIHNSHCQLTSLTAVLHITLYYYVHNLSIYVRLSRDACLATGRRFYTFSFVHFWIRFFKLIYFLFLSGMPGPPFTLQTVPACRFWCDACWGRIIFLTKTETYSCLRLSVDACLASDSIFTHSLILQCTSSCHICMSVMWRLLGHWQAPYLTRWVRPLFVRIRQAYNFTFSFWDARPRIW